MFRHPATRAMPSPEFLEHPSPRTGLKQSLRRLHHSDPAVFEAVIPNVFHHCSEEIDLETLIPMMQPSPIPIIINRKITPVKTNCMSREDIRDLSFNGPMTKGHVEPSYNDSGFESDVSFGSPVFRKKQNGISCRSVNTPPMVRPSPHRPIINRSPVIKQLMRSPDLSFDTPIVRESQRFINRRASVTPQMKRLLPRSPMPGGSPIVRSVSRPLRRLLLKRKLEACQSPVPPVAPLKRRRIVDQHPVTHIVDEIPALTRFPDESFGEPNLCNNQDDINHHEDVAPEIDMPCPRDGPIVGEIPGTEPLTRLDDDHFDSAILCTNQNVVNCQASVTVEIEASSTRAPVALDSPIVRPLRGPSTRPLLKRKLETCDPPCLQSPPVVPFKRRRMIGQPPVTPLQRDLDAILQSIRKVFFFNCMAFSANRDTSEERDRAVREMRLTSDSYSHTNLVEKDSRQNYSNWQVRWGYIFVYLMRHAHLVYHSLKLFHLTRMVVPTSFWNIPCDSSRLCSNDFLQKCRRPGGVLRVCAIGGGPGSDLIGLALFLRASKFPVKMSIRVLDLCTHWQHTWNSLFDQLPPYLAQYFLDVRYEPFDYLRPDLSPDQRSIIAKADVITVVKSLSPVASRLSMVKPTNNIRRTSVFNILSTASSGAVVLYLDNRFGKQREVMRDAIRSAGGYYLLHHQITKVELPSTGFSDMSSEFMRWVGYGPSFRNGRNEAVVLARNITG